MIFIGVDILGCEPRKFLFIYMMVICFYLLFNANVLNNKNNFNYFRER